MSTPHWSRHPWYHVREIERGVYCIAEPSHVNSFLVLGSNRAALIDTGLNVADIAAVVRSITDVPVLVVNTHYHHDHTGNNWRFADIAIHELGADQLSAGPSALELAAFITFVGRVIEVARAAIPLDDTYFHLFEAASAPRPFPAGFDPLRYSVKGTAATVKLADGDEIDLGGRKLRVIHTPGHTPDSICLLESEAHVLFGGDTINTGPVYVIGADSDVVAFRASCHRLAKMTDEVAFVGVAHFGRTIIDRQIIVEHAAGFDAVVNGDARWRLGRDYAGNCAEAVFDRFSIFVPFDSPCCSTALIPGH